MIVLATYGIKGGVGKTASAVNLAHVAACEGRRVLLLDLDPQGAATFYFRIKARVRGGVKAVVRGKRDLRESIRGTDYEGLDLLPSDFSYRKMDLALRKTKRPSRNLARRLEPLSSEYDLIVLDSPPGISLLAESLFVAVDGLVTPVVPTTLSARTFDQLDGYLRKKGPKKIRVLPFLCMIDRRKSMHRTLRAQLRNEIDGLLHAEIPYSSHVEQMGLRRAPVTSFAPRTAASKAYTALWREILEATT